MRRKNVFDRWITREAATRYVDRFGGVVRKDINGYTLLISAWREAIAFVR